jgi:asparagine synthase (glutamine-hydrolysing)
MCGITGIIGNFDKILGTEFVQRMLSVIKHRGPDSNGYWVRDGFAFGMQRLSIIDIEGGEQPIWDENSGVGIVFNGEIYNFKKIKESLETSGITFHTHCDTEVILQLYLQKGIDAIHDLEGMFGICLYDPRVNKIVLVRDRLGVKPLYYYHEQGTFVFGSEIKSILEILPKKPDLNKQSLWHYLTLRYVPSPESIWENIYKIEPGHYLEYDMGTHTFKITKYWENTFRSEKNIRSRNYEKEFETLFLEAVEKRLLASDVPVGILLSGGLDSSCIAAAAVELGHKNFHTFSIGFEDGGQFSELLYAETMAKYIRSNHHEVILTQNQFIDFVDDFVWYADEPLADLASIPLYYVSKFASEHVKVVLSGEGADETLAGYNLDVLAKKLSYLKILSFLPSSILKHLPSLSLKTLSNSGYTSFLKETATHMTNVFSEDEKKKISIFFEQDSSIEFIKKLYDNSSSLEPIDQLQQVYCQSWLVEDLLMKADKMSMATSLELRVPFLDHKLVEWCATLPLEWKVGSLARGFTTKRILRCFAEKRIPKEIITRPNQGFPVPAYKWIQSDLFDFAQENLHSKDLEKFFNKNELNALLKKLKDKDVHASHQVWSLIIFSKWIKKWNV